MTLKIIFAAILAIGLTASADAAVSVAPVGGVSPSFELRRTAVLASGAVRTGPVIPSPTGALVLPAITWERKAIAAGRTDRGLCHLAQDKQGGSASLFLSRPTSLTRPSMAP
jgi:hypothetical protein